MMMATWFWLNIPLMVLAFAAIAGIPYWLVFKHPDHGPVEAVRREEAALAHELARLRAHEHEHEREREREEQRIPVSV
jgi:hypothetical protein